MPEIYVAGKEKKTKKKPSSDKEKKMVAAILEKPTTNPLAAFVAKPKDLRFETQERKEKIILLLRRHWITNLPWMGLTLLLLIAPTLLRFVPLFDFLPPRFRFVSVIIWYLLVLGLTFENFLTWFFNVNIVTDERVVDIDFYSLIYKEISHCKIDRIQDVTYKMGGVVQTFFNYGDVMVQTAGEKPVFEFEAVPRPALVVKKINELIVEEEREKLKGRSQ